MAIPRVIHQLWKDEAIPPRFLAFRESWARLNPGWAQQLWTDRDLLTLVEDRYPELAAIYVGYERSICRADLGRYLVLRTFGGVYADLDCECVKPIDRLLGDADFAIGVEPDSHVANPSFAGRRLQRIICPSFIASAPGHPFWDAVLDEVRASTGAEPVLDQTGPFALGRAYDGFADQGAVRLLPAAQVYPLTFHDCWRGGGYDIEYWERATRQAYVIHYWDSGWHLSALRKHGLPSQIPTELNQVPAAPEAAEATRPRISCLMPSSGRAERARGAIAAYLGQAYAERELIIAAAEPEAALVELVRALARPDVRIVRLDGTAPGTPFSAALIDAAGGDLVCAWAEDAAHDPSRLALQHELRRLTGAGASLMGRAVIWHPRSGRIGVGDGAAVADSILGPTAALRAIAGATDEEAWRAALDRSVRTVTFDLPRLMARISFDAAAFEPAWLAARTRFPVERTDAVLGELDRRMSFGPLRVAALAVQNE